MYNNYTHSMVDAHTHACMCTAPTDSSGTYTRVHTDAPRILGQETEDSQALACIGNALGQAELEEVLDRIGMEVGV